MSNLVLAIIGVVSILTFCLAIGLIQVIVEVEREENGIKRH